MTQMEILKQRCIRAMNRKADRREVFLDFLLEYNVEGLPHLPLRALQELETLLEGWESEDISAEVISDDLIERYVRDTNFIAKFITRLADVIHEENVAAGWWTDLKTGESILHTRNVPEMLMLMVSEISEAMEGFRVNLSDDKLPHRPSYNVELIDAMIRILDNLGSRQAIARELNQPEHPSGVIFEEKRAYNRQREDHKIENRKADGGKAF